MSMSAEERAIQVLQEATWSARKLEDRLEPPSWKPTHPMAITDIAKAIRAAEAEAYERGRREAMQWQPIETAPEDEMIIIFALPDWVGAAYWVLDEDAGIWAWWWAGGSKMHENHLPVRWMPLPPPPATEPDLSSAIDTLNGAHNPEPATE